MLSQIRSPSHANGYCITLSDILQSTELMREQINHPIARIVKSLRFLSLTLSLSLYFFLNFFSLSSLHRTQLIPFNRSLPLLLWRESL
ncbi:hypothetical protein RIF29_23655 [Crotalaria pallida]|uniref:Uncharacterized protein n=1 Tax=Crotalaria pallida TaxID=3830 RepID=A0AAN9FAL2_CROPI